MHEPHLVEEMVSSLERYEPPLGETFIAEHCQSLNDVYLAADTLRFALMVYLELPPTRRAEVLRTALKKRSLSAASTGDGRFAIDPTIPPAA